MTKTSSPATGLAGLTAVAVGAVLLLAGCSGQAAPVEQSLTVTYQDGGEPVEVSVDLPAVECSELAGTLLYTADGEGGDDDWGLLRAGATADRDNYTLSLGLDDGLWFISTDTYTGDAGSMSLDEVEGIVTPVEFDNGVGRVGTSVDTAATASGSLQCTTSR